MFKRVDKLLIDLPVPEYGDANAASAVQELQDGKSKRNTPSFIATAQTSLPGDSMGNPWRGDYVFSSGEQLVVREGTPEGYPIPDLEDLPEMFAPGIGPDEYAQIAKRLLSNM